MYESQNKNQMDELVNTHAVLVKRIAHHLMGRLPDSVQVDDLIQAGMIGLLEAARNYDRSKGATFETYAGIRIRGSMLDEVRKGDWVPRSVHRNSRRVSEAIHAVEARTGRDAQDQEVANEMDISLDEFYGLLKDTQSARLFSFEEMLESQPQSEGEQKWPSIDSGPYRQNEAQSMQVALAEAIKTLPEREQLILSLYYDEELNLKEIGVILGVSESRVSQIHSQAAHRLRSRLRDWRENDQ
ncbi:RNA polymerase sigma factor FliA [Natronospirillum operosum]|uniref:RNA polymerase sigma factor FliA n=1 Tax=Natronospirillum operosum TaxID=2759953 RepID=A0A4Z0WBA0_9GAMM|nr:RNA polymerase sigma factor FliA [Natronospirillum operosum]TGG95959.1 RNA polymerase sigma factor FliA [Natronospirillum operosum]